MASDSDLKSLLSTEIARGLDFETLPEHPGIDSSVPHAPKRSLVSLSEDERRMAVKNALRYFPKKWHPQLAKEFKEELLTYGHIYCYRFRPTSYEMKAYPFEMYPGNSKRARSIMLMIMNNLNPTVAQFPHELITYGGNGSVFSNWAQYRLTMKYLSMIEDGQTLTLYSGHPLGIFPSTKDSPIAVVTNGIMVPNFSNLDDYTKGYALGTTQFGQMTAGSYAYIGSQGIVHGTTLTIKNGGRKYLHVEDLAGKVFVSSGLGGMSGAQPKAGEIAGCVAVVAEIYKPAIEKRHAQGWVKEVFSDLDKLVARIKEARQNKEVTSIAYHGNVVDLWEKLAQEDELLVDLGSDQTSCHIPFTGGYYPAGYTWDEANEIMAEDPDKFKKLVEESLVRQFKAIKTLTDKGMSFFDYGNNFLNSCNQASGGLLRNKDPNSKRDFIYPSYVQDIMGDIFSLGFGPFRWVCTSGKHEDLVKTDKISAEVIEGLMEHASKETRQQLDDNLLWINKADENKLVVGSEARILYSDTVGRMEIALAFNKAIREGKVSAPVVLSRDHHDVSGADSPFRETSNIYDGSYTTADMTTHTMIGNAHRGASWASYHQGGGTGWGRAINCGFGFLLDGTKETDEKVKNMLFWDVTNGLARRQWSYHPYARRVVQDLMQKNNGFQVTLSNEADDKTVEEAFQQ